MATTSEGKVILKERYGSTTTERIYVKPTDQNSIVVIAHKERNTVIGWLYRVFLPAGFPDSVSADYIGYQIWDTAQAFCSTITGTLSTAAVLRGAGVGDASASAQAAAVTWVLRDACSHVGRILFAYTHGSALDAYSKQWRLYADILNDAALIIDLSVPSSALALCVSSTCRALVGVAGGATRAALTQHHAARGNMAEVSAADSAQETAVNLTASLLALPLLTYLSSGTLSWLLVIGLVWLHVYCNTRAVRAVCLRTLNAPRFSLLLHTYLCSSKTEAPSPRCINDAEPLPPRLAQYTELSECGFRIHMGVSLQKALDTFQDAPSPSNNLQLLNEIYSRRKYILIVNRKTEEILVLLKEGVRETDIIRAYMHAFVLAAVVSKMSGKKLRLIEEHKTPFSELCQRIASASWCQQDGGPSVELLRCLDEGVDIEWDLLHSTIFNTGWDVSKHLLMVDEWRLANTEEEYETDQVKDKADRLHKLLISEKPFAAALQLFNEVKH